MNQFKLLFLSLSIVSTFLVSCSKDKDEDVGTAVLSLRLTDAPGNFDAVFVDIQSVEFTGGNGNAVNLNVNPGIYNLLDFTNGMDTLIAMGTVSAGQVQQIRLILGSNNSVVVDGITYPLATPSAQQSGLKLQIHDTFLPGIAYMLLLDFDAQQSIVEQGNGSYSLKPVIRVINSAVSGSVKGVIVPSTNICSITADGNGLQYSTYSNASGSFLLMGIPQGIYTVTVTPDPPLAPVVFTSVTVVNGGIADVGTIIF